MHYHVVSFQEYCCQVTKDRCPGFFLYYTKHAFLIFTLLKLSYCLTLMFDSNEFFILFTCKYIPYLTLLDLSCCLFYINQKEIMFPVLRNVYLQKAQTSVVFRDSVLSMSGWVLLVLLKLSEYRILVFFFFFSFLG